MHDFALFKKSKTIIHRSIEVVTDLGFLGLQKLHDKTRMPHRATKLKPLTKEQKKENREIAQKRVISEHKNRQCKIFRITKDLYRGKHKNYGLNWNLVAAIVNLKTSTKHLNYAKP